MKGINKYINDILQERTYGFYQGKLTSKLRVKSYSFNDNIILYNKTLVYSKMNDKRAILELVECSLKGLKENDLKIIKCNKGGNENEKNNQYDTTRNITV